MNLIVAADQSWGIGNHGSLLVHIPADLMRFRALTMGHAVILGRKTLASLPGGRPLPGRRSLVLSSRMDFHPQDAEVFHSLDSLLEAAPEDSFVIGGAQVYKALLPWCATAYVTRIEAQLEADCHFPDLDQAPEWHEVERSPVYPFEHLSFYYTTYKREC